MSTRSIVMAAATGAAEKLYVDDVFSTFLYTGNGSTQTINNGIDLAGEGGLVWLKSRNVSANHSAYDTVRGATIELRPNDTGINTTRATGLTAFGSSGFTLGSLAATNTNGNTYASWTFRRAPKFFDVVTYTGDGTNNRQISHSLGVVPGMVIVKRTDTTGNWRVVHIGNGTNWQGCSLNTTAAAVSPPDSGLWGTGSVFVAPTSTNFTVGNSADSNTNGGNYVAYLFAHDTAADGMIQCGSYTGNGSATGPTITLGWEPQYILVKRATGGTGDWLVVDSMRGLGVSTSVGLEPNSTSSEPSASNTLGVNPTGFQILTADTEYNGSTNSYIYLAIRRPNKLPTSGTQVYNAIVRNGTGAAATVTGVGFAPDTVVFNNRFTSADRSMIPRLTGVFGLSTNTTAAEADLSAVFTGFGMDGVGVTGNSVLTNENNSNYVNHFFRRAPGFFDVVCYTGTGVARAVEHGLGAVPELMIVKPRSITGFWRVYSATLGNSQGLSLNATDAAYPAGAQWDSTTPTVASFRVNATSTNTSATTYIAYLFASLPGISKVGSYTGNGSSQTIACGFTTGARFILIKRTDSTGDWYVWDTTRGIIAANDPHLSLNTTAAEVTTNDSVDPDNSGFIVNQVAATNINVTSATYIYLAIA